MNAMRELTVNELDTVNGSANAVLVNKLTEITIVVPGKGTLVMGWSDGGGGNVVPYGCWTPK
jgi:hypothetical protein